MGIYDAGSSVIAQLIVLLPFFIGRQIFRGENGRRGYIARPVMAGFVYSVLMLFEIRIHSGKSTIGFTVIFPRSFYRQCAMAGLDQLFSWADGLLVAFFIMTSAVAATAFWRTGTQIIRTVAVPRMGAAIYLTGILMLCKTLSALLYGAILMPLVRFATPALKTGSSGNGRLCGALSDASCGRSYSDECGS